MEDDSVDREESGSPEQCWSTVVQSQTIRSHQPMLWQHTNWVDEGPQTEIFQLSKVSKWLSSSLTLNILKWTRLCWKVKKNANSAPNTLGDNLLQIMEGESRRSSQLISGLSIVNSLWTFSSLASHCPLNRWSLGISTWEMAFVVFKWFAEYLSRIWNLVDSQLTYCGKPANHKTA